MAVEIPLSRAISVYLENIHNKTGRAPKEYSFTLQQFLSTAGDRPLGTITKQDLSDFLGTLRTQQLSDRTCHNKISEVITLIRHFGIESVKIKVKFTEKAVKSYRPDELKALFTAANEEEFLLFNFYLVTGCREQEVQNAEYEDLDFVDGIFTVQAKPGWRPKDYEVRELPLPDYVLAGLKGRLLDTKSRLIFPAPLGGKDGHMLRRLKELQAKAGLPGDFTLHQFRRTFATLQHRAGTDARTIQKRLGHSSLETTLRYLSGEDARSEKTRAAVNGCFGVFA